MRIRTVDDETPRHRGDARDLDPISKAPTQAPISRVRDVLPFIFVGNDLGERIEPAGDPPVPIARDVVLTRLDNAEAELILLACMPRGHYFVPTYQQTPLWGFERQLDVKVLEHERFGWDPDGTLIATMKLSRLVVDNAYTPEFAVRIVDYTDGQQQIIPQGIHFLDLLPAYRLRDSRDWFGEAEAATLGRIVDAYWKKTATLPKKVARALSLSEGVTHTNVCERALVLLMMGLEALLNAGPVGVTKQMKVRMRALAAEVGADDVSGRWAERMYAARSKPAHGQELRLPPAAPDQVAAGDVVPSTALADGVRLQDLLRAAVRPAIEDDTFAAIFKTPSTISARWPVKM